MQVTHERPEQRARPTDKARRLSGLTNSACSHAFRQPLVLAFSLNTVFQSSAPEIRFLSGRRLWLEQRQTHRHGSVLHRDGRPPLGARAIRFTDSPPGQSTVHRSDSTGRLHKSEVPGSHPDRRHVSQEEPVAEISDPTPEHRSTTPQRWKGIPGD